MQPHGLPRWNSPTVKVALCSNKIQVACITPVTVISPEEERSSGSSPLTEPQHGSTTQQSSCKYDYAGCHQHTTEIGTLAKKATGYVAALVALQNDDLATA